MKCDVCGDRANHIFHNFYGELEILCEGHWEPELDPKNFNEDGRFIK